MALFWERKLMAERKLYTMKEASTRPSLFKFRSPFTCAICGKDIYRESWTDDMGGLYYECRCVEEARQDVERVKASLPARVAALEVQVAGLEVQVCRLSAGKG